MKCNICDSLIEEDNGDIVGEFGICPVAFCVWCISSMTDMVVQLQGFDDIDTLEERIEILKEEQAEKDYNCEICRNEIFKFCNCKPVVNRKET
jgi:hypothetical protein